MYPNKYTHIPDAVELIQAKVLLIGILNHTCSCPQCGDNYKRNAADSLCAEMQEMATALVSLNIDMEYVFDRIKKEADEVPVLHLLPEGVC